MHDPRYDNVAALANVVRCPQLLGPGATGPTLLRAQTLRRGCTTRPEGVVRTILTHHTLARPAPVRRGTAFLRNHLPAGPPHRAPRPVRVTVALRHVRDRAPYAHVFDHFPQAPIPGRNAHWISVRVAWPAGTPWRYEHAGLSVLPSRRTLARPGGWYRIPLAFAKVIARDARR